MMSESDTMSSAAPASAGHDGWMSADFEPGLVSVIVPTYNRAHLIVETLESVFAQTYRPIEAIVVDDGSTDNTEEAIRNWLAAHREDGRFRLRYICQEKSGAPAARNRALRESRGEYVQYLDSDDLIHPDKFAVQIAELTDNPEIDYVWSSMTTFTDEIDWHAALPAPRRMTLSAMFRSSGIWTASGIYRRRICMELGPWNTKLRRGQDWEYNIRLVALGRLAPVEGLHSGWRTHSSGRISDMCSKEFGTLAQIEAACAARRWLRERGYDGAEVRNAVAHFLFGVALDAIRAGHARAARTAAAEGLACGAGSKRRLRLMAIRMIAWLPLPMAKGLVGALLPLVQGGRAAPQPNL